MQSASIQTPQYTYTQQLCAHVAHYDSACYAALLSGCFAALAYCAERYRLTFSTLDSCLAFGGITAFNTALIYKAKKYWQPYVQSSIVAEQNQLHSSIAQVKQSIAQVSQGLKALPYVTEELAAATLLEVDHALTLAEWKQQINAIAQSNLAYNLQQIKQQEGQWLQQWRRINRSYENNAFHSPNKGCPTAFEGALLAGVESINSQQNYEVELNTKLPQLSTLAQQIANEIGGKSFSAEQTQTLEALINGKEVSQEAKDALSLSSACLKNITKYLNTKYQCLCDLQFLDDYLNRYSSFQEYRNLLQAPVPKSAISLKMACAAFMTIVVWEGTMQLHMPVWPPSQWHLWMALPILQVIAMPNI